MIFESVNVIGGFALSFCRFADGTGYWEDADKYDGEPHGY